MAGEPGRRARLLGAPPSAARRRCSRIGGRQRRRGKSQDAGGAVPGEGHARGAAARCGAEEATGSAAPSRRVLHALRVAPFTAGRFLLSRGSVALPRETSPLFVDGEGAVFGHRLHGADRLGNGRGTPWSLAVADSLAWGSLRLFVAHNGLNERGATCWRGGHKPEP